MKLLTKIFRSANYGKNESPTYRFDGKTVWIVWLFPEGREKAPQFYGVFSTQDKAMAGIKHYEEMNKPVENTFEMYLVDFRLFEKTVRYYKEPIPEQPGEW